MSENNEKDNPKNDNTLNGVILPDDEGTNIEGLENDIKKLEAAIFTKDNLKNIKADEGSDLYNFLNDDKCTINNIINNAHQLSEEEITNFLINNKVYKKDQFCSEHEFVAALLNGKAGHFCTYGNGEVIFNSLDDGRQVGQCCGIHAIEGVLIAEALKSLNDNDKKYNDFVSKYKNAFLDNENKMTPEEKANREKNREELKKILEPTKDIVLKEQRKIFLKTEVLDALMSIVQTDEKNEKVKITPPNITDYPDFVIWETGGDENERQKTNNITCINKLHELYFKEFQARCTALQTVKQKLGLEPDKVKLDKVLEAPKVQKVKTQEQNTPVAPQQIQQKKEIEIKVQKPATRIVVENSGDIPQKEEQKEKDKQLKYGTPVVKNEEGESDKNFDLPSEPKKKSETVSTQEVIKEEPDQSRDTQNSEISTTSSILSEHPKMKQDTVYDWTKKEDTKIETYDIEDNKIKKIDNINEKAAQLYLDILIQVINETNKENGLEEMTEEKIKAIKNETDKRVDACFTIRDENNNIIENLTKEDKEDLKLARTDYKNRAEADERVINKFNELNELKNCQIATKEIQEKLLQQQAIASKA